jgi:hypothetical protein
MAAYQGEVFTSNSDPKILCFTAASVVIVSGAGPNSCGHALLYAHGGPKPHYFQVAVVYGFPRYMDEAGYQRYLKEEGKTELTRVPGNITDPQGAMKKLRELMLKKWLWLVLPHNCIHFAEVVIKAGGGDFHTRTNCPAIFKAQEDYRRLTGAAF